MKQPSWAYSVSNAMSLMFRSLGCLLVLLTLVLKPDCAAGAEPDQSVIRIRQAEYIISDSATLPGPDAGWSVISLPHHVAKPAVRELVNYWYKASFDAARQDEPIWVLFPQLVSGGDIYVNGALIGSKPWANEQIHVRWYRPELWLIPPLLLHEGMNEIEVRLGIRDRFTSFGVIDVWPEKIQRETFDRLLFWEDTTADISTALCLLCGTLILVFWVRRPQEKLYGLFGLCVLFWGMRTLLLRTPVVPVDYFLMWRLAYYFTTAGFIVLISIFMLQFSGRNNVLYNRILIGYWLSGCAVFMLLGMPMRHFMEEYLLSGFLFFNLYAVATILIYAARLHDRAAISMGLAITVALGLSVHDLAVQEAWVNMPEVYLMHLGMPAFMLVMIGILLDRFLDTLEQIESVNEKLEIRVAAREGELKQSYEQLRKLERAHAATDERHRILQDMHDGVGSQLLSTLMLAQHTELPQSTLVGLLQECLDDMRLVIDSMTPDDRDLLPVLGNFRFRMESRFRSLNLQFDWCNHDMPQALEVEPDVGLNALRILQEALANILKHAQATHVVVDIFYQPQMLRIRIADNGCGFTPSSGSKGRGVSNMRNRAKKIRANIHISALDPGTEVALEIPLAVT